MRITADQQHDEERAVGGERARPGGHVFLPTMRAGDGQHRDDHQEAADEHGDARAWCCTSGVLALRPAKAEPLLPAPLVKA